MYSVDFVISAGAPPRHAGGDDMVVKTKAAGEEATVEIDIEDGSDGEALLTQNKGQLEGEYAAIMGIEAALAAAGDQLELLTLWTDLGVRVQ